MFYIYIQDYPYILRMRIIQIMYLLYKLIQYALKRIHNKPDICYKLDQVQQHNTALMAAIVFIIFTAALYISMIQMLADDSLKYYYPSKEQKVFLENHQNMIKLFLQLCKIYFALIPIVLATIFISWWRLYYLINLCK